MRSPLGGRYRLLVAGMKETAPRDADRVRLLASRLAHAWWGDRLSPDWPPHALEQNQAILDRVGLTGPFWRLR